MALFNFATNKIFFFFFNKLILFFLDMPWGIIDVFDKFTFFTDVKNLCCIHLLIKTILLQLEIIFSLSFFLIEPLNDNGSLWKIKIILVFGKYFFI